MRRYAVDLDAETWEPIKLLAGEIAQDIEKVRTDSDSRRQLPYEN